MNYLGEKFLSMASDLYSRFGCYVFCPKEANQFEETTKQNFYETRTFKKKSNLRSSARLYHKASRHQGIGYVLPQSIVPVALLSYMASSSNIHFISLQHHTIRTQKEKKLIQNKSFHIWSFLTLTKRSPTKNLN